jgi:AAA+ ATPase superfamily predicted ATPase
MPATSVFIDRETELASLEKAYTSPNAEFFVVYGRRRLGKTRLLREFIKDKPAIYFLATEEREEQNREFFKNLVAEKTDNELLASTKPERWEPIFKCIKNWEPGKKKCLVIDEFQYIGLANPAFPSILQRIWDLSLCEDNIFLILCGSLVSMMRSQTLNYSAPLYGRQTGQIRMKQIPFSFYTDFMPGKKRKTLIEYYAVTGGVPHYIELFKKSKSLLDGVRNLLLNTGGTLYNEPDFIIRHEVSSVSVYFSILRIIAEGNRKLSAIASRMGVKQSDLSSYISGLIELDILEREVPITEEFPEKSRMGMYRFKDNFMNFWFKYIYPNRTYIESGETAKVERQLKTNFIDYHAAFVYEDVCREFLFKNAEAFPWKLDIERAGRWWNKNTKIDILALDTTGCNAVFCECKFRRKPIGIEVLHELEAKAAEVPWHKNERHNYYCLFSVSGFDKGLQNAVQKRDDVLLHE